MPQLTIYLDEEMADTLKRAAKEQGKSRSALAQEALRAHLAKRFPNWWYALLGSLDDERSADEIMRDIRSGPPQRARAKID